MYPTRPSASNTLRPVKNWLKQFVTAGGLFQVSGAWERWAWEPR